MTREERKLRRKNTIICAVILAGIAIVFILLK